MNTRSHDLLQLKLEEASEQAEALLQHCIEVGDHKAALDALGRVTAIIESLTRLRPSTNPAEMDEDEFLDYCFARFEGRIPLRLLDKVIGKDLREQFTDEHCPTCDGHLTKFQAEKIHGLNANSTSQVH